MTYQTTPYKPWIFPDEAYAMNRGGLRYSEFPSQSSFNPEIGPESPFALHEVQVAMDRVHNTQRAKLGMEGRLNTTARSQREMRPASRSAVPNGVFVDSPPGTYTSGNAFRGGRIYTKEGQEWLAQRLKQRIGEYDALATSSPAAPPKQISLSPNTIAVDSLLSQIFSAFSVGNLSSAVITALNDLPNQFIRIGAQMTPAQVTKYSQAIQRLFETTRPFAGTERGELLGVTFETREKRLRSVDQINQILKVTDAILREIARTINDPLSARQQVMSTLSERVLGAQISQFNPRFAGEERATAAQFPGEVQLGPSFRPVPGRPGETEEFRRPLLEEAGEGPSFAEIQRQPSAFNSSSSSSSSFQPAYDYDLLMQGQQGERGEEPRVLREQRAFQAEQARLDELSGLGRRRRRRFRI